MGTPPIRAVPIAISLYCDAYLGALAPSRPYGLAQGERCLFLTWLEVAARVPSPARERELGALEAEAQADGGLTLDTVHEL
jgi:hypothetical protein